MGASYVHKLLLTIGFISLFHAAFSAAQHRSYLRITSQEFTNLPIDVLLQAIISMLIVMYGVLSVAGEFKEIRSTVVMSNKTWETQRNIPSFYTFNHRGRALSPNYGSPLYAPMSEKSDLEKVE